VFPLAKEEISNAAVVIFRVGTNNIVLDEDADQVELHYRALVSATRRCNPLARVIVTGVLPRLRKNVSNTNEDFQQLNAVADEVNGLLCAMCSEVRLPFYSFWVPFLNRDFISRDGLHLSPSGISFLRRACLLNSCSPTIFSKPGYAPFFQLSVEQLPSLPNSSPLVHCDPPQWPAIHNTRPYGAPGAHSSRQLVSAPRPLQDVGGREEQLVLTVLVILLLLARLPPPVCPLLEAGGWEEQLALALLLLARLPPPVCPLLEAGRREEQLMPTLLLVLLPILLTRLPLPAYPLLEAGGRYSDWLSPFSCFAPVCLRLYARCWKRVDGKSTWSSSFFFFFFFFFAPACLRPCARCWKRVDGKSSWCSPFLLFSFLLPGFL